MTFRTHLLAGLVGAIAAPAIALASSSGPTAYDLQSVPTLWSYRTPTTQKAADQKEQGSSESSMLHGKTPQCCAGAIASLDAKK